MEEIIKKKLSENINNAEEFVEGSEAKYTVKVLSNIFIDKTIIERHKIIYALLNEYIKSGEIHALTIKALTVDENK